MHYQSNLQNNDFTLRDKLETERKLYKFLENANITVFKMESIPFDASLRRYFRIITSSGSYILMDSSLDTDSMTPFIEIDKYLVSLKLHAPKIISYNQESGYMLLEDLGANIFTKYIEKNPDSEYELYDAAIDALLKLNSSEMLSSIPSYDTVQLNKELEVFLEWYVKNIADEKIYKNCAKELIRIFEGLYPKLNKFPQTVVLKDYMADNLIWLPERAGLDRVGILDFQDARIGSPLYDLGSLLQDARRDVSEELQKHCINRFVGAEPDSDFMDAYELLALQKNLRIIGVFNRLNLKYKKPKYLGYIPRIWKYIERNLECGVNKEVKDWFKFYAIPKK